MILREVVNEKVKKDGTTTFDYKYIVNKPFWKDVPKPISIVFDEAHELFSSRDSMTKTNKLIAQFTAMIRRFLGEGDVNGDLIYITQLVGRIDKIAREMAHEIHYHVCYWNETCLQCGFTRTWSSEMPRRTSDELCPCGYHKMRRYGHRINVKRFGGNDMFNAWKEFGVKSWYEEYYIDDGSNYFELYDTHQWSTFFDSMYDYVHD